MRGFVVAVVLLGEGVGGVDLHPVGRPRTTGDEDDDQKGNVVGDHGGDAHVDDGQEIAGDGGAMAHAAVEEKNRHFDEAGGEDVEEFFGDGELAFPQEEGQGVVPCVMVFAIDVGTYTSLVVASRTE